MGRVQTPSTAVKGLHNSAIQSVPATLPKDSKSQGFPMRTPYGSPFLRSALASLPPPQSPPAPPGDPLPSPHPLCTPRHSRSPLRHVHPLRHPALRVTTWLVLDGAPFVRRKLLEAEEPPPSPERVGHSSWGTAEPQKLLLNVEQTADTAQSRKDYTCCGIGIMPSPPNMSGS